MKVFLSSTFLDLVEEREAVLRALRQMRTSTLAMEDFLASPSTPVDTALEHLRASDLMILVIGSKAGSLLPGGLGGTYTSAEYDELIRLGKEALPFVKYEKRWPWSKRATWRNKERSSKKRQALEDFKNRVGNNQTWDEFSNPDQLVSGVILAINRWESKGRPGARKTFASVADYFKDKSPSGPIQLLDFNTNLLGRDDEMRALGEFAASTTQRAFILSGRGGIGKSKILHDWAMSSPDTLRIETSRS